MLQTKKGTKTMARTLSPHDIKLLQHMAPEFAGEECSVASSPYKSLLTPIAKHYAADADDFVMRIQKLSPDDLQYLCDLIISGKESLHCMPPDYFSMLVAHIKETIGAPLATRITAVYVAEQ
jgi:hypothetical protein